MFRWGCAALGLAITGAPTLWITLHNFAAGDAGALVFGILYLFLLVLPLVIYAFVAQTALVAVLGGGGLVGVAIWAQVFYWTSESSTAGLGFLTQIFLTHLIVVGLLPFEGLLRPARPATGSTSRTRPPMT